MNRALTIRPHASRFAFLFLGLGICVFTWGLQYKLSLYYPSHSSYHCVPEAKLLSRNEQPSTAPSPHEERFRGAPSDRIIPALPSLGFILASVLVLAQFNPERKRPWPFAAKAGLDAFFFRPPPIAA